MFRTKVQVNVVLIFALLVCIAAVVTFLAYQRAKSQNIAKSLKYSLIVSERKKVKLSKENEKFRTEVDELNSRIVKLQAFIEKIKNDKEALQQEMYVMRNELDGLTEQLRIHKGMIISLEEVKPAQEAQNSGATELRERVRELNSLARQEMNNVRSKFGNHGFFVKDTKPTPLLEKNAEYIGKGKKVELEKIIVKPQWP